jgi:ribosomal protein S18 acetylase RimI-like enzyme
MIRAGAATDVRFLRDMLRHAFHGRRGGEGEPLEWRYVVAWGRRGDRAVLALEDGFPVGAAWYRLFPAEEPGFGFVDEATPELAIAVVPARRGKGIGSELLDALLERARADGYGAISLSVEPDNPALALYESRGFGKVAERGGAWTMRAEL